MMPGQLSSWSVGALKETARNTSQLEQLVSIVLLSAPIHWMTPIAAPPNAKGACNVNG